MSSGKVHLPAISVLSLAESKHLRSLSSKKGRESAGNFLVEGWKSVSDALDGGWVPKLVVLDSGRQDSPAQRKLVGRLIQAGVEIRSASAKVMGGIADVEQSQGIIASIPQKVWSVGDLTTQPAKTILVLDGVGDPGNVGTLIRTAAWFGASGVLLGPGCASLFNEKVVRSTAGALFRVRVASVSDLSGPLKELRNGGYEVVGTDAGGHNASELRITRPIALVLGNEAHGMSAEVRSLVSSVASIPGSGDVESLNVASAGAILLYMLSLR